MPELKQLRHPRGDSAGLRRRGGVLPRSSPCHSQVGVSTFTAMGYVSGCVVRETLTLRLS